MKVDFYLAMAKAAIPVKFWDAELSQYDMCVKAKMSVEQYLDKLDLAYERGIGLYLFGGRGLGKSFLEAVIVKHVLRKGYSSLYTTLSELVSLFGDGFYNKGAREEYQEKLLGIKFLVIDDIDKTFSSEKSNYVPAAFDQLFRTRSNELLPTIVSSNRPRQELFSGQTSKDDNFYASALSLLSEHVLDVPFTGGKDKRSEMNLQIRKEFLGD